MSRVTAGSASGDVVAATATAPATLTSRSNVRVSFLRSVEELESVVVYATTCRAVRINLVRTALVGTTDVVARGIQRLGLYDRLKRSWRKRLQSGDSAR